MAAPAAISWSEANQACLVTEFIRLKRLLSAGDDEAGADASPQATGLDPPSAIDALAGLFGLSEFERDIVLLAAGTEMDPEIAGLCPQLTLGVALAVLPRPHWSALSPDRPLREFGLIQLDTEQGLTSAAVRIDERVLHYLAGLNPPDPRIRMLVKPIPIPTTDAVAREHAAIAENALALLSDARGQCSWSSCVAMIPTGRRTWRRSSRSATAASRSRCEWRTCRRLVPISTR